MVAQMDHKNSIVISNALTESGYRLTLAEHRILLSCIAQIKRGVPLQADSPFRIYASDIAEMAGIEKHAAYTDLQRASNRFFDRYVTVDYDYQGRHPAIRKMRWVSAVDYINEKGFIELYFTPQVLPYISDLSERFTVFNLSDIARMTSTHAIRLYELLVQWRSTGKREVEIDWMKRIFQIEDKYKAIKDLKKYVIQPAVNQINEMSPLWVKWDQRKTGRRVSHVIFTFGEKSVEKKARKQRKENAKRIGPPGERPSVFGISPDVIQKHARPGESWNDAALRAKDALHELAKASGGR